jgi:invasion protein IalB
MRERNSSQRPSTLALILIGIAALLALGNFALADEAGTPAPAPNGREAPKPEVKVRGQRMAGAIKYGDWHKVCFKAGGANAVCRTTMSGTWETGQSVVRADLIERDGDGAARLQLFLPVGLFLPAGVKVSVDKNTSYQIPYVWCLTNTCIAAQAADPQLIQEMEKGHALTLEVVDSSVLAVSTELPLEHFVTAHRNVPAQIFEQDIDE